MSAHNNLWFLVNAAFEKYAARTLWIRRLPEHRREAFTYSQIHQAANMLAERLHKLGVAPGDPVGILSVNGPEWGAAAFAVWKLGGIVAPLHHGNSDEELQMMAEVLQPKLILVAGEHRGLANTHDIVLEGESGAGEFEHAAHPADGDDEAVRIYTSGSTGRPKQVRLSHNNVRANVIAATRIDLHITPEDRFISLLPSSHAMGLSFDMLLPLHCGASMIIPRVLAAGEVLAALGEEKISRMVAVPRLFRNIMLGMEKKFAQGGAAMQAYLRLVRASPMWLRRIINFPIRKKFGGRIRAWVSGGSRLDPEVSRYFRDLGLPMRQGYGLTECSPAISVQRADDPVLDSVGEPLPGVEVKLKDPDAAGHGVLMTRGPNLMLGYVDQTQTDEVMEDGWFNTGDIARLVDGNNIVLVGRSKRLIVTEAGKNVYPEDLEIMLERYSGVKEAGVLEVDMQPAAILAMEPERRGKAGEIIKAFNKRVSSHNQIRHYAVVEELPRTPLGKIALRDLPEIFRANRVA